jgi:hypothetical protein
MEAGDIIFMAERAGDPLVLRFGGGDYLRLIRIGAKFTVEIVDGQSAMGYSPEGGIANLMPPLPLDKFMLVWDWDDMTRPIGEEGIFDFATFMTARLPNNDNSNFDGDPTGMSSRYGIRIARYRAVAEGLKTIHLFEEAEAVMLRAGSGPPEEGAGSLD